MRYCSCRTGSLSIVIPGSGRPTYLLAPNLSRHYSAPIDWISLRPQSTEALSRSALLIQAPAIPIVEGISLGQGWQCYMYSQNQLSPPEIMALHQAGANALLYFAACDIRSVLFSPAATPSYRMRPINIKRNTNIRECDAAATDFCSCPIRLLNPLQEKINDL